MHRFRAWGLATAASLAVSATLGTGAATAADTKPTDDRPWYKRMFGGAPAKPQPAVGPVARSGPVMPARPAVVTAPLPTEVMADALRAEQEAYLRRLSVCSELRRVAAETNNDGLARQADDIERQAGSLYNQRVAALGVPKVRSPLPEPSPFAVEDPVSPKTAAARLTAPAAPTPATGTVRTADVREVPR